MKDVKLKLEKVLKVLCRYLTPFFSYRENPAGGGAEFEPSSAAGRVLVDAIQHSWCKARGTYVTV